MDMSAFRKHLENVHDQLNHPQASAMYEELKTESPQSLESAIRGVSNLNEARIQDAGEHKVNFKSTQSKGPGGKRGMYSTSIMKKEDAAAAAAVGGKKKKIAEDALGDYLNNYFDGTISEDTSDDDIMEAITNLFELEAIIVEFLENENADEAITEAVNVYLDHYFNGELTEDTSEEELSEAIADLLSTAEQARIALD